MQLGIQKSKLFLASPLVRPSAATQKHVSRGDLRGRGEAVAVAVLFLLSVSSCLCERDLFVEENVIESFASWRLERVKRVGARPFVLGSGRRHALIFLQRWELVFKEKILISHHGDIESNVCSGR